MLFFGFPGTGKTSAILATINELKKKGFYVNTLELNASDQRGIEAVRNDIKVFASTKSILSNTLKIII